MSANNALTARTAAMGRLGSFWTSVVPNGAPRSLVRALCRLGEANSATADLELGLERLTGQNDNQYVFRTLHFESKNVYVLGGDLNLRQKMQWGDGQQTFTVYRRPPDYSDMLKKWTSFMTASEDPAQVLKTESECYILQPSFDQPEVGGQIRPEDLRTKYLIPIPYGAWPQVILTATGYWVQGLDFETGLGVLITPHDPLQAFPDGRITCQLLQRHASPWMDYVLAVDNIAGTGEFVADYYRNTQNPGAFERAIAEAAGLQVLPWDAVLQEVTAFGRYVYYRFDQGLLITDYPHDPMPVGEFYRRGVVIGGGVKVYAKPQGGGWGWFRQLDWSAGLSLDNISPFKGLTAPDRPCRAYALSETDGNLHTRIQLDGDESTQERYWTHVAYGENATGHYLNDVVGLTNINDVAFVNPVDIYWQYLLSAKAIVVELKTAAMGDYWDRRARVFIDREKPSGSIVLLR